MASPLKRKLKQLNDAINESRLAQHKAAGDTDYWAMQAVLDKVQEQKVQLLKEAVQELYKEFGYDKVKHRLDNLKEFDDAKERFEEAKGRV